MLDIQYARIVKAPIETAFSQLCLGCKHVDHVGCWSRLP